MKVLFTFGGIPHYLNAMLNRLQAKGVEITVVSPKKGNTTIGKGVKMVEGGIYKHLTTPEKKMFYGKSAFPALPEIIAEEKAKGNLDVYVNPITPLNKFCATYGLDDIKPHDENQNWLNKGIAQYYGLHTIQSIHVHPEKQPD